MMILPLFFCGADTQTLADSMLSIAERTLRVRIWDSGLRLRRPSLGHHITP